MKFTQLILIISILFLGISCDVKKTQEGEAPDVEVQTESGELPEYEVNWADVNVDTRTKTVTVPKLVVVQEEEEVEVPYVDVSMPEGQNGETAEKTERTIVVEAEIKEEMHEMSINKVYATDDNLIVLAELNSTGEQLQDQTVRVSDQLIISTSEDLDVEKYIVGSRPEGDYNMQYEFINSENEMSDRLSDAKLIYSK